MPKHTSEESRGKFFKVEMRRPDDESGADSFPLGYYGDVFWDKNAPDWHMWCTSVLGHIGSPCVFCGQHWNWRIYKKIP